MDIVFIRQLRIDTVIGVYEWERRVRQTLIIDLELGTDIAAAAAEDNLEHAVDYAAISERIVSFVEESEFQLIETLAERVAAIVQSEFAVPWLRLRLAKPGAVKEAEEVGVYIERGSRS